MCGRYTVTRTIANSFPANSMDRSFRSTFKIKIEFRFWSGSMWKSEKIFIALTWRMNDELRLFRDYTIHWWIAWIEATRVELVSDPESCDCVEDIINQFKMPIFWMRTLFIVLLCTLHTHKKQSEAPCSEEH